MLVVEQLQQQAIKKNIQLNCHINPSIPEAIFGDKNRISQIMFNLIGNAVKFTNSGAVNVNVNMGNNNQVEISIKDTGIGISQEAQQKLFTPFYQVDGSITRKYGGTGLGLTISLLLLEKMNGNIELKSKPNVGSTFKLTFPITVSVLDDQIKKHHLISTNTIKLPLNILIAEDSKTNQLVAKLMLEKRGHNVTIANNGNEAKNKVLHCHKSYDLVLMDISMPIMDGIEATKHIRTHNIAVPIAALTANAMKTDQDICFNAGMNDFLTKPIQPKELDVLLAKYQYQKQQLQQDCKSDNNDS